MFETKPKNKKEAIERINSTIKDCKNWRNWDLNDKDNWRAMVLNLESVKLWIREDVSSKGVWEVKKNVKP